MTKLIQWVLILFFCAAAVFGVWVANQRANGQGIREVTSTETKPDAKLPDSSDKIVKALAMILEETRRGNAAILAKLDAKVPAPPEAGAVPFQDYAEGYARAIREGRPLLVWIAYKCPSSANQLPEYVHVRLDSLNGDDTQRVAVGLPDGAGGLWAYNVVSAPDCCANALKRAAEPPPPPVPQAAAPVTFRAAPMMTAMASPMRGGQRGGGRHACAT